MGMAGDGSPAAGSRGRALCRKELERRGAHLLVVFTGGTTARAEQGGDVGDEMEVGDGSDWPKTRPWAALKEPAHVL